MKPRLAGFAGLALVGVAWFLPQGLTGQIPFRPAPHGYPLAFGVWHGAIMLLVAAGIGAGVFFGLRDAVGIQRWSPRVFVAFLAGLVGALHFLTMFPGSMAAAIAAGCLLGAYLVMYAPRATTTPLRRLLTAFVLALLPLGWLAHDYWQVIVSGNRFSERHHELRLGKELRATVDGLGRDLNTRLDGLWREALDEDDLEARIQALADDELARLAYLYDPKSREVVIAQPNRRLERVRLAIDEPLRTRLSARDRAMRKSLREELANLAARMKREGPATRTLRSLHIQNGETYQYFARKLPTGAVMGILVDHDWFLGDMAKDRLAAADLEDQVSFVEQARFGEDRKTVLAPDQMPPDLGFMVAVLRPGAQEKARDQAREGRFFWQLWFGILLLWAVGALGQLYRTARADVALAEMKANFVSAISHELKTPLAMIKMYSEMLLLGLVGTGKKPEDYHAVIIHETDRLTRLIDNVLDFSKIQKGTKQYHIETVDLEEVVTAALGTMAPTFEREGVHVTVEADAGLRVRADADAVSQALHNLLSNAAKYGGQAVRVRLHRQANAVHLAVQDLGPGIPRREQQKVFRPFYRVGREEERTAPGAGLGLALVSATMKAHGGEVRLESKPGAGSTFTLVFPASAA